MNDTVCFVDWNIVTLNGRPIIIMFLFDWVPLFFMGFVFIISSLVTLYSVDHMFGDFKIFRFILLVLMFVCTFQKTRCVSIGGTP